IVTCRTCGNRAVANGFPEHQDFKLSTALSEPWAVRPVSRSGSLPRDFFAAKRASYVSRTVPNCRGRRGARGTLRSASRSADSFFERDIDLLYSPREYRL